MPTDEELALKLLTGSLKVSETKGKRRRFVWGYPKHNSADEEEALRALARTLRDLARTFYESPHKSLSNPNWPVLQAVADALDPDVAGRKLVFNKPRQRDAPKISFSDFMILAEIYTHIWQNGGKKNAAKRAAAARLGIGDETVKRVWKAQCRSGPITGTDAPTVKVKTRSAEAWVHPECHPFWFRSHALPKNYSPNDDANSQKDG
jgi:hypothetical protein